MSSAHGSPQARCDFLKLGSFLPESTHLVISPTRALPGADEEMERRRGQGTLLLTPALQGPSLNFSLMPPVTRAAIARALAFHGEKSFREKKKEINPFPDFCFWLFSDFSASFVRF